MLGHPAARVPVSLESAAEEIARSLNEGVAANVALKVGNMNLGSWAVRIRE